MKITDHVYQVGGSSESGSSDAAIYLIKGDGEAALVDAGTGDGHVHVIKNIENSGVRASDVSQLFVTHCHYDHTGGINLIKNATGCKVIAHELDAEFLEMGDSRVTAASWYGARMEPTRIDVKVEGVRAEFLVGGLAVTFYHTPGHSPGSSVLTLISDGKLVLFGQDVHGPLNEVLRSSRSEYEKSLEFMISLEADILCEGHFGVFIGKDKVRNFIQSFL
jgi:glyoxylase-like metal-dependent hydrolase (beta-lactamase superfamily II)